MSLRPSPASRLPASRFPRWITIGYVPLTDCAPLIVAKELNLFARHGLDVRLSREAGWATVREKMLHGELDAAHAPASMVFEMSFGLGVPAVPSLTGLVMAHHGNAITLSDALYEQGVRSASDLRNIIARRGTNRRLIFAGVLKYSSQHYIMRRWLQAGGIDPDRDVELVVVPPPLMAECMEQGHLDGYCVAEPWSSVGLLRGVGQGIALSADFSPHHPEKVFMVREDFDRERRDEHLRLLAALIEAAAWCDEPANRPALAELLAAPDNLAVPASALRNALVGPYHLGPGRTTSAAEAIVYHRDGLRRPSADRAAWALDEIRHHGLGADLPALSSAQIAPIFRTDLYDQALSLLRK